MTQDLILNETAGFILENKENLKLAIQIERAMPEARKRLRERLIKEVVKALEGRFPEEDWRDNLHAGWDEGYAQLKLIINKIFSSTPEKAEIILGTDKENWSKVWVACYFRQSSQELPRIKQIVEELTGRGFTSDTNGRFGVYKYLNGDLRNWNEDQFLARIFDGDIAFDQIVSRISDELEELVKIPD